MRKKVVHIITGLNGGGAEGVLVRLCQHSNSRVEQIVVSLSDTGIYGDTLRAQGIRTYLLGMKPSILSLWRIIILVRIIRRECPDVVQTWMYHADLIGGIAAYLSGVRHIFWNIRRTTLEPGRSSCMTRFIAKICSCLSGIIPEKIICCAHRAVTVHQNLGYSKEKFVVIQNGYDFSRFYQNAKTRNAMRFEMGVRDDEFLLGMVARYDPCKDHQNLLEALVLVKEKASFQCILTGMQLPENKVLRSNIKRLGLEENVKLIGFRKDIEAVMNALDIHVLSSSSEGFPNVLAEAMACGTPAICTDVGDAREILGDDAMCCPPQNPTALADLILRQISEWQDTAQWNRKKMLCAQKIMQKFSIDSMALRYISTWFPACVSD